ncbi:MAG: hypothetical protein EBS84_20165 [Proteobacteria bacterium]|nr:hypothetical protein [Verrucomicrobiota bacterium]NBU11296.1 hypothetical protein [Pseudomonadota bacterium]
MSQEAPLCREQVMMTAPYVHVFDRMWLQETFWPYWDKVKRAINKQLKNKPLENTVKRGICDEITKRFVSELIIASRQLHGDEDVGVAALESSVMILQDRSLNYVPGLGGHRTCVLGLTDNGETFEVEFVEPQLTYAMFQTTKIRDAIVDSVEFVERWV